MFVMGLVTMPILAVGSAMGIEAGQVTFYCAMDLATEAYYLCLFDVRWSEMAIIKLTMMK